MLIFGLIFLLASPVIVGAIMIALSLGALAIAYRKDADGVTFREGYAVFYLPPERFIRSQAEERVGQALGMAGILDPQLWPSASSTTWHVPDVLTLTLFAFPRRFGQGTPPVQRFPNHLVLETRHEANIGLQRRLKGHLYALLVAAPVEAPQVFEPMKLAKEPHQVNDRRVGRRGK